MTDDTSPDDTPTVACPGCGYPLNDANRGHDNSTLCLDCEGEK